MERLGKARQGVARLGKAWQGFGAAHRKTTFNLGRQKRCPTRLVGHLLYLDTAEIYYSRIKEVEKPVVHLMGYPEIRVENLILSRECKTGLVC